MKYFYLLLLFCISLAVFLAYGYYNIRLPATMVQHERLAGNDKVLTNHATHIVSKVEASSPTLKPYKNVVVKPKENNSIEVIANADMGYDSLLQLEPVNDSERYNNSGGDVGNEIGKKYNNSEESIQNMPIRDKDINPVISEPIRRNKAGIEDSYIAGGENPSADINEVDEATSLISNNVLNSEGNNPESDGLSNNLDSSAGREQTELVAPKGIRHRIINNTVRLSWNAVDNATGYRVYHTDANNSEASSVDVYDKLSYDYIDSDINIPNYYQISTLSSGVESGISATYIVKPQSSNILIADDSADL